MKLFFKVVFTLFISIFLLLTFFILSFIVLFGVPVNERNVYFALMILSLLATYLFFINLTWKIIKNIKIKRIFLIICLGISLIGVFNFGRIIYSETVLSVEERAVDYWEYNIVASDSKISRLKEDSKLKFTDKVPKMDGATALYPVYAAFARATYPKDMQDHDYVAGRGTITAYNRIISGDCDIIFVASPSKEQKLRAEENGVKLQFIPIGKEAFVFLVNSSNPINDISVDDIKKIYSGEYTNWSDLGVNGYGKIRPFQRANGSGSQTALENIMGDTPIIPKKYENYEDFMSGMIHSIAVDEGYKNFNNAIGYSFRFYATKMVTSDKIKLLSINGKEPSVENIKNGTYPLAGDFYAVVREDCSKETKDLIDFILSEQGQYLVEDTGYVRIKE